MTTLVERLVAKTKQGSVFRRRRAQKLSGKTNGSDLFLAAIITKFGETQPDVDLCGYQENPAGILMELADDANNLANDAQGLIDDGININYARPDNDDEFLVVLQAGQGCTIEEIAVVSDQAPGFAESMAGNNESIAAIPPFRILGKFMETLTGVGGQARHAWVKGI